MSLLSALRHTVSKSEEPYTEYQEEPFDLIVDNITVATGLYRRDMADMFRDAFKKELYGIEQDRDRWRDKALMTDVLLKEIQLLRAEIALSKVSTPPTDRSAPAH